MRANADADLPLPLGDRRGRHCAGLVGVRGAAMKIRLPSTAPKLTHGQLAHEITLLRQIERDTGVSAATSIEIVIKAWENGQ